MNSTFQFKHFAVEQKHASMKVGTDGVLLGAWAKVDDVKTVLDIGTGTGLIALMIAQRNPKAKITAIEIDEKACVDAATNFKNSPWAENIDIVCDDLLNFQPKHNFDLIVSNPPFFSNSLLSPKNQRNKARHDLHLSAEHIFRFCSKNLTEIGSLCLIYPADRLDELNENAHLSGLYLNTCCVVKPTPTKAAHRVLLEYKKERPEVVLSEELIIEISGRHQYSNEYKALTCEFYLAF